MEKCIKFPLSTPMLLTQEFFLNNLRSVRPIPCTTINLVVFHEAHFHLLQDNETIKQPSINLHSELIKTNLANYCIKMNILTEKINILKIIGLLLCKFKQNSLLNNPCAKIINSLSKNMTFSKQVKVWYDKSPNR